VGDTPYNVLLIVVDCLRYDHTYLFDRTLSHLGQRVWFSNAYGTGPASDTNFATILTGAHPDTHKVLTQCMDTDLMTLPQALRWRGYNTLGASVKYSGGLPKGLSDFYFRGFDEWSWLEWVEFDVERMNGRIANLREPWFAMLRPMDLHEPSSKTPYDYVGICKSLDGRLDWLLGKVLKRFPNTVVVLTADHGQGLGERGMWRHGEGLWGFLTHVPAVFAHPDFRSTECGAMYQHMDTTATIAGLCGADFETEGIDWSLYLRDVLVPKRIRDHVILYALGSERRTRLELSKLWSYRAMRSYFWSYYESRRRDEMGEPELYFTLVDPLEEHNLAALEYTKEKAAEFSQFLGWPEGIGYTDEEEELVLERLRAIGYAD
jgi:arylsulfatase A-like enzyme